MAEMTQSSFVLKEIKDYVDIEIEKVWFSFEQLRNKACSIDMNSEQGVRVAEMNKYTRIAPDFGSTSRRTDGSILFICANLPILHTVSFTASLIFALNVLILVKHRNPGPGPVGQVRVQ